MSVASVDVDVTLCARFVVSSFFSIDFNAAIFPDFGGLCELASFLEVECFSEV